MLLGVVVWALVGAAPANQDSLALRERGKRVYDEQRCRLCHAIAGAGNKRSPLDGVGGRLTAAQIRTWIVAPRQMDSTVRKRAYSHLSSAEVDALVAYLRAVPANSKDSLGGS